MQTFTVFCNGKKCVCLIWKICRMVLVFCCPIHLFFPLTRTFFFSDPNPVFFSSSFLRCVNGRFRTTKEFNVTLDQHSHHFYFCRLLFSFRKNISCAKEKFRSDLDSNEFNCKAVIDILINGLDILQFQISWTKVNFGLNFLWCFEKLYFHVQLINDSDRGNFRTGWFSKTACLSIIQFH